MLCHDTSFDCLSRIRLCSFQASGFPMGCATAISGEGIVGRHAYSILDLREVSDVVLGSQPILTDYFKEGSNDPTLRSLCDDLHVASEIFTDMGTLRLVKIRNPWGMKSWTGAFSNKSSLWTKRLSSLLDKEGSEDNGTFWISYHDMLRRFVCVDVAKAHKGWFEYASLNQTTFLSPFPGLINICPSVLSLSTHSHHIITVTDNCWLYLYLIQKTKRGKTKGENKSFWYSALSFTVSLVPSVSSGTENVVAARFSGQIRDTPPLELHLTPGQYRIVPLHFREGVETGRQEGGRSLY